MSFAIVLALAALAQPPASGGLGTPDPIPTDALVAGASALQALAPADAHAQSREGERKDRAEDLYDEGTSALDDGAWDRAVTAFEKVADLKGRRADAALYWTAYARSKQGQGAEALATVEQLRKAHPQSRWLKEAKALELEIRQRAGQAPRPEAVADEDLKLMALNGLMNTEPDRAIPMLEKFLQGNASPKLQERALFVLCQSPSPKARQIVSRVARGESQPDLQRRAIKALGVFGNPESRQVLEEIYAASSDASVKKSVLQAFMVAGEKERVLEAARSEKDHAVRRQAVHLLGAMGARAELWAMYQSATDTDSKKAALQSLGVSGDSDRLLEVARSDKDQDMRITAMKLLGPFGGKAKSAAIVELYKSSDDARMREAALSALFVSSDAHALVEIARSEKDPELRKRAVSHLANMHSDEATKYLLEILEK